MGLNFNFTYREDISYMLQKLRNIFRKDDIIRTQEDLQKVFENAGMPDIKIFTVETEPEIRIYDPLEKLKVQIDCRRKK